MQLNLNLVERKDFHRKKTFPPDERNEQHEKRNLIFPRISVYYVFAARWEKNLQIIFSISSWNFTTKIFAFHFVFTISSFFSLPPHALAWSINKLVWKWFLNAFFISKKMNVKWEQRNNKKGKSMLLEGVRATHEYFACLHIHFPSRSLSLF